MFKVAIILNIFLKLVLLELIQNIGHASDPIHQNILAESCVLIKQSFPIILCHQIKFGLFYPKVTIEICRVP